MIISGGPNQTPQPQEYQPPRPYVWKTDEFQVSDTSEKKSKQINQVQPLGNLSMPHHQGSAAQHPLSVHQQSSAPAMNYGYRCPRCGTQNFPQMSRKISTTGWIVFAVLLIMFFPLFWIGFLIKEDVKICPVCNLKVG
jgi:hypothetical protein